MTGMIFKELITLQSCTKKLFHNVKILNQKRVFSTLKSNAISYTTLRLKTLDIF